MYRGILYFARCCYIEQSVGNINFVFFTTFALCKENKTDKESIIINKVGCLSVNNDA